MNRRRFLLCSVFTGTVATAGCVGGSPETEGNDDSPIEAPHEELFPPADVFGEQWNMSEDGLQEGSTLYPGDPGGDTVEGGYRSDDGSEVINIAVTFFSSVEAAKTGYQRIRDSDSQGSDDNVEDLDIASESYLMTFGNYVYIRDANVLGALSHVTEGSSDSVAFAGDWHQTWRS